MISRIYSSRRMDLIRARSFAIWEREGRPEGKSEEHWLRAEMEIEAECRAVIEGENLSMVLPLPRISKRPIRRAAEEIEEFSHSEAA